MKDIGEDEIKVFSDAIGNYFKQITEESADIQVAFLSDAENLPPTYDFTGHIPISGRFQGGIYFSAPRPMIRHLLITMKEPEHSDENFLDAVGEIANTVAGNARKHFGAEMEIAVPTLINGFPAALNSAARARPYVIRLGWKRYSASLIVDLARKE